MLSPTDLQREAETTGFRSEALEKVFQLLTLLDGIRSHPYLESRLVLKGGTALNLFLLDVPRLSVDIDLNYIGAVQRHDMLAERPQVERAIEAVCARLGMRVRRVPEEHAGGKLRISYLGVTGRPGTLEVDLNFLLRTPLWAPTIADSRSIGTFRISKVPVLDLNELVAGKLAALFGRAASRDLFDTRELLTMPAIDVERLRFGFVVYGGINRRDWRDVSIDEVRIDPREVERRLVPLLRASVAPARAELAGWSEQLVADCRDRLSLVLPLRTEEREFLDHLNERGEIVPELLTGDQEMQQLLRKHPGLLWKALNVRKQR
jgi:hypothetical protein